MMRRCKQRIGPTEGRRPHSRTTRDVTCELISAPDPDGYSLSLAQRTPAAPGVQKILCAMRLQRSHDTCTGHVSAIRSCAFGEALVLALFGGGFASQPEHQNSHFTRLQQFRSKPRAQKLLSPKTVPKQTALTQHIFASVVATASLDLRQGRYSSE